MKYHFPVVIIDEHYNAQNASGLGIRGLAQALEALGMEPRIGVYRGPGGRGLSEGR